MLLAQAESLVSGGVAGAIVYGAAEIARALSRRKNGSNGEARRADFRIVEMMHEQGMQAVNALATNQRDLSECMTEMAATLNQVNENVREIRRNLKVS